VGCYDGVVTIEVASRAAGGRFCNMGAAAGLLCQARGSELVEGSPLQKTAAGGVLFLFDGGDGTPATRYTRDIGLRTVHRNDADDDLCRHVMMMSVFNIQ
jgi:hypothetical protein